MPRSVGIERSAFPEEPCKLKARKQRGWPLWFLHSGAVTRRSSTRCSCTRHCTGFARFRGTNTPQKPFERRWFDLGADEELHERFLGIGSQWRVRMAVCDRRVDDLNINIQLCNWNCREDPEAKADSSNAHTKNSGNTAAWGSCSSSSDACHRGAGRSSRATSTGCCWASCCARPSGACHSKC